MRDLFLATLLRRAQSDARIMLLTADLGFKVLDPFREALPEQFLNVGIAEQNMIGIATGMALSGKIVFVYSIANFSSLRCLEQIRNDACYHGANVKVVSIGAGLSYGQLGISHHATEDITVTRAIPDLMICSPGDDFEVVRCTHQVIDHQGCCYLRLDREGISGPGDSADDLDMRRGRIVRAGSDALLVTTGGMLAVALKASEILKERGITPTIVSLPTLAPFDPSLIESLCSNHRFLFTLEEHSVHGGLGGLVAENILESMTAGLPRFYRFGLREGFSAIVGDQEYLRETYGLDHRSIAEKVSSIVNSGQQ